MKTKTSSSSRSSPGLLSLLAAGVGLATGYFGPLGWQDLASRAPSTPLLRVASAVAETRSDTNAAAWKRLTEDSEEVRDSLDPKLRPVFDLVAESVGLMSRGVPNPSRIKGECKNLHWPNCDERTITALQKGVVPR